MRNILIADDHEVTRRGLRELLRDTYPHVTVVEAADSDAVLAQLDVQEWDLILLDVMMPGIGILALLAAIREKTTKVPILVLTAATEVQYVIETMKAGANGLIHKHRAADELVEAMGKVASGGTYLHPDTAVAVAAALRDETKSLPHSRLSARELEIFRLIALGRAVKEVAAQLELSDKTVATYLARIREKTGLMSHVDIARYALHHGLVD
jgi:two-component system invasion response regulator UvrY